MLVEFDDTVLPGIIPQVRVPDLIVILEDGIIRTPHDTKRAEVHRLFPVSAGLSVQ